MTVSEMLNLMRDPLGAPFYPPALQVLLVITWVLHIFFVTAALGNSLFSIVAFTWKKNDEQWLRLGRLSARLTPNTLGARHRHRHCPFTLRADDLRSALVCCQHAHRFLVGELYLLCHGRL